MINYSEESDLINNAWDIYVSGPEGEEMVTPGEFAREIKGFKAGWNAAKYQYADAETGADNDLYSWLDSIVHEAMPHNYEDLSPRELREALTSALYERLTEDKDFQST